MYFLLGIKFELKFVKALKNVVKYFLRSIVKQRAEIVLLNWRLQRSTTTCNNLIICTILIFLEWTSLVSDPNALSAFCLTPLELRRTCVLACRIGNQWTDERNA